LVQGFTTQYKKNICTDLINGSVSVFDAMKLLRHRNITITMKYYTFADSSRIGNEADKIYSKMLIVKIFNMNIQILRIYNV